MPILLPTPLIDSLKEIDQTTAKIKPPEFAKYDLNNALDFLKQYDGNQATFDAYRREIERLLQWTWLIAKKSILELVRQDIQNYIEFCLCPPLSWISTIRTPRFIERGVIRHANPRWRPFVATVAKQDYKKGKKQTKLNTVFPKKLFRKFSLCLVAFIIFYYSTRK